MTASISTATCFEKAGLHRIRTAVWLHFFAAGFLFATWGVQIPEVKRRYGLDEALLGGALLAASVGAAGALLVAGRLIPRLGAVRTAHAGVLASSIGLASVLAWPGVSWLVAALMVFGFFSTLLDVSMNAEVAEMEARSARRLMSTCHGMFSVGGMCGAAAGSGLLALAVPAPAQLAGVALAMMALAFVARRLQPAGFCGPEPAAARRPGWRPVFPRAAIGLGVLAALAFFAEGSMYDWSVLYLRQELASAPQQAALAYACFSAAMAAGRFSGDWLRARVAAATLLVASATLAACALALTLALAEPRVALAGFALVGLGLSNVVPVLLGAAARLPGGPPAAMLAAVSALGYLGLMAGPAVIGAVAHASSLATALVMVVAAALVLAASARRALRGR